MQKSKRKVCVVTGSRADYGLLYWLMKGIKEDRDLVLQVVAAGSHLESRFGNTYKQIIKDGFRIDKKVRMDLSSDTDRAIVQATGRAVSGFGKAFAALRPDIIVVLGDRFEILASAVAAVLMRIPVAHIHGGEVTEGAYDDRIRHAITKMSYLHFVSHKEYADRVIQMGEEPKRVFNFGAPGLDNIKKLELLSKNDLEKMIGFKLGKDTALVTYHPVTLEKGRAPLQIEDLLSALRKSGVRIIFTLPNADAENKVIIDKIKAFVKKNRNKSVFVASLGQLKYLSLMKYAGMMIGNSSSGIIEAPSFKLPVVNIGERQKGRIKAKNVIDCGSDEHLILKAIKKGLSKGFADSISSLKSPFGSGNASLKILKTLKTAGLSNIKKGFYDL